MSSMWTKWARGDFLQLYQDTWDNLFASQMKCYVSREQRLHSVECGGCYKEAPLYSQVVRLGGSSRSSVLDVRLLCYYNLSLVDSL
jgi:hypothetical protein